MNTIDPVALFRLTVLGPLASREGLERGELKSIIKKAASYPYDIPGSKRVYLSEKTIEAWYYAWKRGGIDALAPKIRTDKGRRSKLPDALQEEVLRAKKENPRRSINTIKHLLETSGKAAQGELSRSAIHRLLCRNHLSRPSDGAAEPVERRAFVTAHAGDLWYGDVMHGPKVPVNGRMRKVYLASVMDDASRLIAHSAFCTGETALDIEGVLKQALLKRGLPKKFVIDNGSAYRAQSLQGICARLEIRLIYCRPYEPQAKAKLERWHRTVRDQFLTELDMRQIRDLPDLNARLQAWLEQVYHVRVHDGLAGDATPLRRFQQDLVACPPVRAVCLTYGRVVLSPQFTQSP